MRTQWYFKRESMCRIRFPATSSFKDIYYFVIDAELPHNTYCGKQNNCSAPPTKQSSLRVSWHMSKKHQECHSCLGIHAGSKKLVWWALQHTDAEYTGKFAWLFSYRQLQQILRSFGESITPVNPNAQQPSNANEINAWIQYAETRQEITSEELHRVWESYNH